MRRHLTDLLGADAHLVLLIVVGGCSQREAAGRLGLSHDAARKRFQRALARLQKYLADCPNPDVSLAFPIQTQSHETESG